MEFFITKFCNERICCDNKISNENGVVCVPLYFFFYPFQMILNEEPFRHLSQIQCAQHTTSVHNNVPRLNLCPSKTGFLLWFQPWTSNFKSITKTSRKNIFSFSPFSPFYAFNQIIVVEENKKPKKRKKTNEKKERQSAFPSISMFVWHIWRSFVC